MAQTIAEAVFLTSILKALRGREVDIDRTARSLHPDNAPDKRNEAMQFMEPLALKIVDLIESLQPAKQENLTRRKIAELEHQLERYKNKGITLTPDKKQPSSSPSNTTSWTPTPGRSDQSLYINKAMSDAQGPPLPVPSPEADPAPKRRPAKRKTPEAAPDITLDPELLRQGNPKGQQVPLPTSLTDKVFKAWLHERTFECDGIVAGRGLPVCRGRCHQIERCWEGAAHSEAEHTALYRLGLGVRGAEVELVVLVVGAENLSACGSCHRHDSCRTDQEAAVGTGRPYVEAEED